MRLNALYLIGSLAALAIPHPAGAVPAQSAGAVSAQWGRQAAVTAPQGSHAHTAILASSLRAPLVSSA